MDEVELFFSLLLGASIIVIVYKLAQRTGGGGGGGGGGPLRPAGSLPRSWSNSEGGVIVDRYSTVEQVQKGLRSAGLETANLVVGVDFTKSNTWTGERSFGGRCLHELDPSGERVNPYEAVIDLVGRTLQPFDDDDLVPVYGFGDFNSRDREVFNLHPQGAPCHGHAEALQCYQQAARTVRLHGPTSFAPLIREAINLVLSDGGYHILVIVADGQVTDVPGNRKALLDASQYPLSIIMVGVGDGPWESMEEFDDMPGRRFDNFQFVRFDAQTHRECGADEAVQAQFALNALMEIPEQYQAIRKLGLLSQYAQGQAQESSGGPSAPPMARPPPTAPGYQ